MEKRSWIVMVLAASLLGCAVSEPPQRDFADFRMSDLEPLPDFEVESNQLISECQVRRSPPLNESIDGELSATTRIVSAADRNGVRDSTTLNVTWPTASMDAQVLLIDESSCEVIATLDIPDGEVTWDGRVDDVQAPPGVYIAQLASIDGQRLGESIALLVVAEDDPCDLPDAAIDWVYDGVVTSRSDGQHLRIEREGPVHLCIDARTLDGERVPPSIDVNGFRAFSQPMAIGPSRVRFGFPSYGPEHSLQLFQVSGRVSLRVGVLPGSRPSAPASDDADLENLFGPGCYGRLYGFPHPYRAGIPPHIKREGVIITCRYFFKKEQTRYVSDGFGGFIEYSQQIMVPVEASAYTDADGRFSIELPEERFEAIGVNRYATPDAIRVFCAFREECGVETRTLGGVPDLPVGHVGLFYVPDIASNGLVARLVTNYRPPNNPLGIADTVATSLDSVPVSNRPNDLPVVIHEAFDPLLEDGTSQLAWFLNGQIVDHRRQDGQGLSESPCVEPLNGPCLYCRWSVECDQRRVAAQSDPALRANDRFRCQAPNQLLQLLGNGYDVWLVDTVRRDMSVYEIAGSSLLLYQDILDYDGADEDRRLALAGLSLGGVSGRIALRSWEVLDAYKESGNLSVLELGNGYFMPAASQLRYSADRVALFLSFDSPHLGATLPVAFQAYVKDSNFGGGPRFPMLLNSQPASELLSDYVLPNTDTPCWGTGEDLVDDCTLNQSLANSDAPRINGAERLVSDSIDFFADLPPGPAESIGFTTGIPRTIPSVALANGSLTANPAPVSDTVLSVRFDLLSQSYDHSLRTSLNQPLGSGLDTFCSAKELEDETISISKFKLLFADCREAQRRLFGWSDITDFLSKVSCAVGATAGAVVTGGFRGQEEDIDVDIEVPMRPRANGDGQYPTFIETNSALALRPRLRLNNLPWIDYSTRPVSQSHFSVDDEQCRILMYHLDGHMKGDRDGWPACNNVSAQSCLAGARQPGQRIDPQGEWFDSPASYCDPNDNNPGIIPLAPRLERIREQTSIAIIP